MEPVRFVSVVDRCRAWAVNQTMPKPTKWLIIAFSIMWDKAMGNDHWQWLSCVFLTRVRTHAYTSRTHAQTFGLPQLAPPAESELIIAATGHPPTPHPPPPYLPFAMQTQSASGHSTHLLILPENQPLLLQLGIRDLTCHIHATRHTPLHPHTPCFD